MSSSHAQGAAPGAYDPQRAAQQGRGQRGGAPQGQQRQPPQGQPPQGRPQQGQPQQGQPPAAQQASRRDSHHAQAAAPPKLARLRHRMLGLAPGQIIVCEIPLAAVAVALAPEENLWWLLAVAAPVSLVVLVLALVRWKQRWLYQWLGVYFAFRRRKSAAAHHPANDPRLSLLRELSPGLSVDQVVDRAGERVGVVGDGRTWSVVVEIEPGEGVVDPTSGSPVPLELLSNVIHSQDVRLSAVQVLTHTVPVSGGTDTPFMRSYQQLLRHQPAPRRTSLVVLTLDPKLCEEAVNNRGGDPEGAHRALMACGSRLLITLRRAGVPARLLDSTGALAALETCVGTVGQQRQGMRSAERWDAWSCDGTDQVCYWIRQWPQQPPRGPGLLAYVAEAPGVVSTVSLTMTDEDGGDVSFHGLVRLSGRSIDELGSWLEQLAQRSGAKVTRLNGEQAPAVVATLPMGGR